MAPPAGAGGIGRASRSCPDPQKVPVGCRNGTDHVGLGRCRLHAGNTPAGRAHGARLAAITTARALGIEDDLDPLAAMSLCVRLAAGATEEFGRRVAALDESAPVDSAEVIADIASAKQTAQITQLGFGLDAHGRRECAAEHLRAVAEAHGEVAPARISTTSQRVAVGSIVLDSTCRRRADPVPVALLGGRDRRAPGAWRAGRACGCRAAHASAIWVAHESQACAELRVRAGRTCASSAPTAGARSPARDVAHDLHHVAALDGPHL